MTIERDPTYQALHNFAIPSGDRSAVDWSDAPIANRERIKAASAASAARARTAVSAGERAP